MLSVRSASARPVPVERRTRTPPLEGFNARRASRRALIAFPYVFRGRVARSTTVFARVSRSKTAVLRGVLRKTECRSATSRRSARSTAPRMIIPHDYAARLRLSSSTRICHYRAPGETSRDASMRSRILGPDRPTAFVPRDRCRVLKR